MAQEQEEQAQQGSRGSGVLWKVLIFGGIVLVAAIAALLLFLFVLKPMLAEPAVQPKENPDEPKIPATVVSVPFEETYATLVMPPDSPYSSTLLFKVTLECANEATAALVTANQARFTDLIGRLHRNRTREEMADPLVQEGIQRQIQQEANKLLRRLQQEPNPDIRVTGVFYETFYIQDL